MTSSRARRSTCRSASIPATWSSSIRWPWAASAPSRTAADDTEREQSHGLLIHGDAAFAGEGIVQETFNLSQLPGYTDGRHGARRDQQPDRLHHDAARKSRSTIYATDIAKMLQIPIFHVNGEDPEAVAQVVRLAMDFRREFQRDVVIDMYCYRRRGHNESDEPAFTQPLLYQGIENRKTVRDGYLDQLLELGDMTQEEADEIAARQPREPGIRLVGGQSEDFVPRPEGPGRLWKGYLGGRERLDDDVDTGVASAALSAHVAAADGAARASIRIQKMKRIARRPAADGARQAAAGLGGRRSSGLRLAGDRRLPHSAVGPGLDPRHVQPPARRCYDTEDGHAYMPLQHLSPEQMPVDIYQQPAVRSGRAGLRIWL